MNFDNELLNIIKQTNHKIKKINILYDCNLIALLFDNNKINIYDINMFNIIKTFSLKDKIKCICLYNKNIICIGFDDGTINLYDLNKNDIIDHVKIYDYVYELYMHGDYLYSIHKTSLITWHIKYNFYYKMNYVKSFDMLSLYENYHTNIENISIKKICFSGNCEKFALINNNNNIFIYNKSNSKIEIKNNPRLGDVRDLYFSPDNRILIVIYFDCINIYSISDMKIILTFDYNCRAICFHPTDSNIIALINEKSIEIHNNYISWCHLIKFDHPIHYFRFSNNGQYVALLSLNCIQIYHIHDTKCNLVKIINTSLKIDYVVFSYEFNVISNADIGTNIFDHNYNKILNDSDVYIKLLVDNKDYDIINIFTGLSLYDIQKYDVKFQHL